MERAKSQAGEYDAPNRDEIDRMARPGRSRGDCKGVELVEQGYSFSADEGVIIIRGRAELAPLIQATLAGSGSFDYIKTEIVITSEDVLKTREQASVALRHYKAADQDEIDRMLLDE